MYTQRLRAHSADSNGLTVHRLSTYSEIYLRCSVTPSSGPIQADLSLLFFFFHVGTDAHWHPCSCSGKRFPLRCMLFEARQIMVSGCAKSTLQCLTNMQYRGTSERHFTFVPRFLCSAYMVSSLARYIVPACATMFLSISAATACSIKTRSGAHAHQLFDNRFGTTDTGT